MQQRLVGCVLQLKAETGRVNWVTLTGMLPSSFPILQTLQVSNQGKNPDTNKVLFVFLFMSNQEWKSHFDLS